MKRILSVFLSLVLILNILPISALAFDSDYIAVDTPQRFDSYGAVDTLDSICDISALKSTLFDGFYSCLEKIDISAYNIPNNDSNIGAIKEFIWKEMPECFHVYGLGFYVTGSKITAIKVTYTYSEAEYRQMYAEFLSASEKLLSGIKGNSKLTALEKALALHDRLALVCQYDYVGVDERYTGYGALVNGIAVCEGYTHAYQYLLNEVGIPNYFCSSVKLNHAWNIIYINGIPYHVDVTWDDYAWEGDGRGVVGMVGHENFLRSTNGIKATGHNASDFDSFPTDTTYDDYLWQDSDSAFIVASGELYYIDNSTYELRRFDNGQVLCSVQSDWSSEYFRIGNHARLSGDGTDLFYSLADKVYKYDISEKVSVLALDPALLEGEKIYGFEYSDGYFVCDVANLPPYYNGIISYRQITLPYQQSLPVVVMDVTNNLAPSQTLTITMPENAVGYYFGTNETYTQNTYTKTNAVAAWKTVTEPGTYYVNIRDYIGRVSLTTQITFVSTTLDAKGGTLAQPSILTQSGRTFTLPSPTRQGYTFVGWSDGSSAVSATYLTLSDYTATQSAALYAVWEAEISYIEVVRYPSKTEYLVGDEFAQTGLNIRLHYTNGTTKTVSSGFTVSGFDSSAPGTKTITVSYAGYTATFDVIVSRLGVTLSSDRLSLNVGEDRIITATTTPSGYYVTWTTSDSAVAKVTNGKITANGSGIATITAKFVYKGKIYTAACTVVVIDPELPLPVDSSQMFTDVPATAWYKTYIDYAVSYGIFGGKGEGIFAPTANITRAEFVQVLANLTGADLGKYKSDSNFTDVRTTDWYSGAVNWGYENGIVSGMGEGKFSPNSKITREQMCVMLVNYANYRKIELSAPTDSRFADHDKISVWAQDAVYKCLASGLVSGKGEGKFDPSGTATRAEAATIFTLFHKQYI